MIPDTSAAQPVLIVGAGPTGLVLALWLTKLGVRVRIIDKEAEAGTTSRAVAVQARTLELYQQIGLADAVLDASLRVDAVNLWVGGRRAAHVPFGKLGEGISPYPYVLTFAQDEHERLLIARLDAMGVRVERRTELVRLEQNESGVRATLRGGDGREEVTDAPYLAGCDGARSTVREQLGVGFPGGTYSGVFYVADVEARGAAADGEIHVDIEDAEFAAVFPLKGIGRMRLVGPLATTAGDEHHATFENIAPRAVEHLRLDIARLHWFSTYRVHHRVASRFRERRVFLLGDAAHVHSPVGGQGMNTGIGDAVNLAWKLAAVLRDGAPVELLATYEPERIAFARRLVATTDRAFTIVTKPGAIARFIRTRVVPRVLPLVFRSSRMRRFLFRTVSQTAISYPDSALSEAKAGNVAGGDRLPWVPNAGASDNFAPLASLEWQAHVYGDVKPGVADACESLRIPLHVFPWTEDASRAGLGCDACYVIRPDGYVGLADESADASPLRAYLARWRP